jgi:hypothetical protein
MSMNIKSLIKGLFKKTGYEIINLNDKKKFSYQNDEKLVWDTYGFYKVQYGCRGKFIRDWINLDCFERSQMERTYHLNEKYVYYQIHLLFRHPFSSNTFKFGYAEDLIEHFSQADSIVFLGECHRTLKKKWRTQVEFPGLGGCIKFILSKI